MKGAAHVNLIVSEETVEAAYKQLSSYLNQTREHTKAGNHWRTQVFDSRVHLNFAAIETRPDGTELLHESVQGMSGGEGQELIAFIMGAALRYCLSEGTDLPTYGPIILDEGFVKSDSEYTGRALGALNSLGFQTIIAAPQDKANAFEDYITNVAYIDQKPGCEQACITQLRLEEVLHMPEEQQ